MHSGKLKKESGGYRENNTPPFWINVGIAGLYGMVGWLLFFTKNTRRLAGRKIDIEIRYATEIDADVTLLAQQIVKIIRIVLTPLESKIYKEQAKLIFVYADDSWEMRVRNGSDRLRRMVRRRLEANEWSG